MEFNQFLAFLNAACIGMMYGLTLSKSFYERTSYNLLLAFLSSFVFFYFIAR